MTAQSFDRKRLDVYRLSIDYLVDHLRRYNNVRSSIAIARGSALECAAIQDVLVTMKGIKVQDDAAMKVMLYRIVAMLTRMAIKFDGLAESSAQLQCWDRLRLRAPLR